MGRPVQHILLDRLDDVDPRRDHDADPPVRRPASSESLSTVRARDLSRDKAGLKIVYAVVRLQMRSKRMKEKKEIVENWLPRYTGTPLAEFGEYILLTNFDHYVAWFATLHGVLVKGVDRPMANVTADGITLINFGMGSPNAATVMDLLSAIAPKAVLFLGKCGGLKRKNQIGDLILPIAAIRGEGTSNDYLPPEVPA